MDIFVVSLSKIVLDIARAMPAGIFSNFLKYIPYYTFLLVSSKSNSPLINHLIEKNFCFDF